MKVLLFAFSLVPLISFSQSKKQKKALEAQQKADLAVISSFKNHMEFLSGSNSANSGNTAALNYLSTQFKNIGLQPKGTTNYLQQFQVEDGRQIDKTTSLKVNGHQLEVNKEFFPLSYSASKTVSGMPAMALRERGVPWFKDVKDWLTDKAIKGDALDKIIHEEAAKVAAKGATALFLYNSSNNPDGIAFNKMDKSNYVTIPVVYVMQDGFKKYFSDDSQLLDIELSTSLREAKNTLNNVVGYIDNGAPNSVLISSAFNSEVEATVTKPDIGSAVTLVEIAKMISANKAKKNNYIFLVAASKEDDEVGAQYWLNNATVSTPINYCINLSNVTVDKAINKLNISGTASSPVWTELLTAIDQRQLTLETNDVGSKNNQLNSFYQKNIPVISLSTVAKEDNMQTGSNFSSGLQVAQLVSRIIESAETKGKVIFTKMSTAVAVPGLKTVQQ